MRNKIESVATSTTYTLALIGKPVLPLSILFYHPIMLNLELQQPFYCHPDMAHLNNEPKQYQDSVIKYYDSE